MTTRCGFAAIVGAPNAGKSTLLNRLTGAKLSIVSPKAQTTRFRVLGILMRGETQILLVDTPGIFAPKRKLDRAMVAAAWTGAEEADLTMLLVDAKAGARDNVQRHRPPRRRPRRPQLAAAEQDRLGRRRKPAAAHRHAQRAGAVRAHLHGQRRHRRWAGHRIGPVGQHHAAGPLPLPAG